MSRAERRAYKRMNKNQDPYAPPGGAAARSRAMRQRAKRQRQPSGPFEFVTRRFLVWAVGGGLVAGLTGFSLAWPALPAAAYAGLGAALGWGVLAIGVRLMQRRMAGIQR